MIDFRLKIFVLKAAKMLGLFSLSKAITASGLRILCYHNFGTGDEVKWHPKLFMRPDTFLKRMTYLKKNGYTLLELETAVNALEKDKLPDLPVVVTMDDGWYGIMAHAHPVLHEMRIPYTIYVTSYYSMNQLPVFNLVIAYLFHKTSKSTVDLSCLEIQEISETDISTDSEKQSVIQRIIELGDSKALDYRQQLILKIASVLEVEIQTVQASRIFHIMNRQELCKLFEDGVDLQLHTHRHTWPQEKEAAMEELSSNRAYLSSILTGDAVHFCYPGGFYTEKQFSCLENDRIKSATTCEPGFNYYPLEPYALKRFLDGENISNIEFEAEISGFLELARKVKLKRQNR